MVDPKSYVLIGSEGDRHCVELWSHRRLPFEPKGELKEMRTDLADALRVLRCGRGKLLHATYASGVGDPCDAENILFYNVGAATFAHTCSRGLRFERVFAEPPLAPWPLPKSPLHYQSYCPADISADFQHWRRGTVVGRWNLEVPSFDTLKSASRVWYLMKSQSALVETGSAPELPSFGLSVTIGASEGHRLNPPTLITPPTQRSVNCAWWRIVRGCRTR